MASFRIPTEEVVAIRALVDMLDERVQGLESRAKKSTKRRRKRKASISKKGSKVS